MKGKRVKVVKVTDGDRIYIYPKKVVYRKRVNGRFVTKVVTPFLSGLLESDLVDKNIKEKLEKILENK